MLNKREYVGYNFYIVLGYLLQSSSICSYAEPKVDKWLSASWKSPAFCKSGHNHNLPTSTTTQKSCPHFLYVAVGKLVTKCKEDKRKCVWNKNLLLSLHRMFT